MTISNIDINKVSNDDSLYIGVIDLSSEKYNISESSYKSLIGEKVNIRNLSKDAEIENNHIKECIAGKIADILLQKIKLNALQRVSEGSENMLVEIIALLIDMVMYHLPVYYDIEVTKARRQ
ncbi:7423_t:CDS:2, partial [Funneliformis mosseae]